MMMIVVLVVVRAVGYLEARDLVSNRQFLLHFYEDSDMCTDLRVQS